MLTAKQFKFVTIGLAIVMLHSLLFMNIVEIGEIITFDAFDIMNLFNSDSGGDMKLENSDTIIACGYILGIIFGALMLIFSLLRKVRVKALKVMTGLCLIAPILFFIGKNTVDNSSDEYSGGIHINIEYTFPSAPMIIYLLCTLAIGFIWFKAIKEAKPE